MHSPTSPYLTVVTGSRNDDHGGDPLRRTQIFVNALMDQCKEYEIPAELVLVDWNPPPDRPGLEQALRWDRANEYCSARVIRVPPQLHACLRYSDQLPFFQMIAKNVGIRNARGQFVLATNMDILLSQELMSWIARRQLDPGRMYRVDRYDVENAVPAEAHWKEQMDFCWSHLLRVNRLGQISAPASGIVAQRQRDGCCEQPATKTAARPEAIHTEACGDFVLLSRDQWHRLRGYPEFEAYSLHIDSMFCYMAHYGGALQTCLSPPCVAFHIEHGRGSGYTPEGAGALFDRLERAGIPAMTSEMLNQFALKMRQQRSPIIFNKENWGLGRYAIEDGGLVGPVRLLVVRPVPDPGAPDQILWVSGLKPEYDFDRLYADYLRKENRRLTEQLTLFLGEVPKRGKGLQAWWTRRKARWKRSLVKRIARF